MLPKKELLLAEQSLNRYCENRIPARVRDKVRLTYRWRGNTVTLIEERPYFRDPKRWTSHAVAQFRYSANEKRWTLYWADRNSRWHLYDDAEPAIAIQSLLDEINRDPTHIFLG
ncbi:MAG TPA: transposase [Elusimicrobia bacterium]|nr:transposase [Elusimicrobiota bacterium]HBT60548.1 transposase [Elusimicrobiota bacterium]